MVLLVSWLGFPSASNPNQAGVGGCFTAGSSGRTTIGSLISGSEAYLISRWICKRKKKDFICSPNKCLYSYLESFCINLVQVSGACLCLLFFCFISRDPLWFIRLQVFSFLSLLSSSVFAVSSVYYVYVCSAFLQVTLFSFSFCPFIL